MKQNENTGSLFFQGCLPHKHDGCGLRRQRTCHLCSLSLPLCCSKLLTFSKCAVNFKRPETRNKRLQNVSHLLSAYTGHNLSVEICFLTPIFLPLFYFFIQKQHPRQRLLFFPVSMYSKIKYTFHYRRCGVSSGSLKPPQRVSLHKSVFSIKLVACSTAIWEYLGQRNVESLTCEVGFQPSQESNS